MLDTMELVSIVGVGVAILGTVGGFSYKIFGEIKNLKEEDETKRSRIYSRLDEVKSDIESKYTRKDMCQILHNQISETLARIESKVDKISNGNIK